MLLLLLPLLLLMLAWLTLLLRSSDDRGSPLGALGKGIIVIDGLPLKRLGAWVTDGPKMEELAFGALVACV